MELRNTVGILTGASRGIGVYLAEALARKGVNLALAARSKDELEEVAERIRARGVKAIAVPTDVSSHAELSELVARTRDELGPIDLLVNNAGLEITGYSHELDPERIASVVGVNLTGLIQLTTLVLPEMMERKRGHVCNIASVAGLVARPFATVYSATKHGVVGYSWSLRAEMVDHGVEVTVVCPSYVTDVGMYATRTEAMRAGSPPKALKPVSPAKVAAEAITAIEKNRAEIVVGPPLTKVAGVASALSPDLVIKLGRRSGVHRFLRKEATGD
jgi:short-subunit dehydrogenase